MNIPLSFISIFLACLGCAGQALADEVIIKKVAGQVWAGQSGNSINDAVKAGAQFDFGFLRTGADGSFYGTAGPGAKFHIGPDSIVEVKGISRANLACGVKDPLLLYVVKGKLTASSVPGASGYEITFQGGRLCLPTALCVLCTHGDASHIYVARGSATLFPLLGIYHKSGLRIMARPSVAVVSRDGVLDIQPLTQADPGAVSCLLSGASPEIARAIQEGLPAAGNVPVHPVMRSKNPVVSETE